MIITLQKYLQFMMLFEPRKNRFEYRQRSLENFLSRICPISGWAGKWLTRISLDLADCKQTEILKRT